MTGMLKAPFRQMHLVNNINQMPEDIQSKQQIKSVTFSDIHLEIFHAPFCFECQLITKLTTCKMCISCWREDLCIRCYRNGVFINLYAPEDVSWEYYSDEKWRAIV